MQKLFNCQEKRRKRLFYRCFNGSIICFSSLYTRGGISVKEKLNFFPGLKVKLFNLKKKD